MATINIDHMKSAFWVRKMTSIFNIIDTNKNGYMEEADLLIFAERCKTIGKLNEEQYKRQIDTFLEMWEVIRNCAQGKPPTVRDWVETMHLIVEGDIAQRFSNLFFDAIDTNANGVISFEEWKVFYQCIGVDVSLAPASFAAVDQNKDSVLSRDEFWNNYREFFRGMDESHPSAYMFGPY